MTSQTSLLSRTPLVAPMSYYVRVRDKPSRLGTPVLYVRVTVYYVRVPGSHREERCRRHLATWSPEHLSTLCENITRHATRSPEDHSPQGALHTHRTRQ